MIVQSIDELNNLSFVNDFNSYYLSKILNYRFSTTDKFVIKYSDKEATDLKLVKKKFRNVNKSKKLLILNLYRFLFSKNLQIKIRNFKILFRFMTKQN